MSATESCLYCEHCHGIGYAQAVLSLSRQPINAQRVYFCRWHQYQVNVLDSYKKRPRNSSCFTVAADRHVASVKPLPVFKNLETANPVFACIWARTRSNQVAVQSYFFREKHIITDSSARDRVPIIVISTSSTQRQEKRCLTRQINVNCRAITRLTAKDWHRLHRRHVCTLVTTPKVVDLETNRVSTTRWKLSFAIVQGIKQQAGLKLISNFGIGKTVDETLDSHFFRGKSNRRHDGSPRRQMGSEV